MPRARVDRTPYPARLAFGARARPRASPRGRARPTEGGLVRRPPPVGSGWPDRRSPRGAARARSSRIEGTACGQSFAGVRVAADTRMDRSRERRAGSAPPARHPHFSRCAAALPGYDGASPPRPRCRGRPARLHEGQGGASSRAADGDNAGLAPRDAQLDRARARPGADVSRRCARFSSRRSRASSGMLAWWSEAVAERNQGRGRTCVANDGARPCVPLQLGVRDRAREAPGRIDAIDERRADARIANA